MPPGGKVSELWRRCRYIATSKYFDQNVVAMTLKERFFLKMQNLETSQKLNMPASL